MRSPDDVEAGAGQATTTTPPDCAEMLPPEGQASQLLMVMTGSPAEAAPTISGGLVGGFGLKGNQSKDVGTQVAAAVAEAPLTPIVASDEEGGTVQRLRSAIGQIPSARELAKKTPAEAAAVHAEHAAAMKALGFTMDFAPVADVGSGSELGTRSFGNDPTQVSSFVNAVFPAIAGAGVTPVVKHWPGLGAGTTDPHDSLGALADIGTLRARDLQPFDAAIASGVPAIMVTHVEVPGLTAEGEPTSLSAAAITGELRGRQGFTGLVITDSLGMGAVADLGTQAELAEATIRAGADIAVISGADAADSAHARLTDAITTGRIPREQLLASLRRVLAVKGVSGPCIDAVSRFSAITRTGGTTTLPGSGPESATSTTAADSGINDPSG